MFIYVDPTDSPRVEETARQAVAIVSSITGLKPEQDGIIDAPFFLFDPEDLALAQSVIALLEIAREVAPDADPPDPDFWDLVSNGMDPLTLLPAYLRRIADHLDW